MKILDYDICERPREKLLHRGARVLSDAELVAILLRTGSRGNNAVETARLLLQRANYDLLTLEKVSPYLMCRVPGVGLNKAITVAAAMELGRRTAIALESSGKTVVTSPQDAYCLMRRLYESDAREECWCLFLKRTRRPLASMKVCDGGETMTEIGIKQIVHRALDVGASYVIVSHNHPGGNPRPSKNDIELTRQLSEALKMFEIHLMDHIIISDTSYYSFSCEKVYDAVSALDNFTTK